MQHITINLRHISPTILTHVRYTQPSAWLCHYCVDVPYLSGLHLLHPALIKSGNIPTWEQFQWDMPCLRHLYSLIDNQRPVKLLEIKQIGSVQDYVRHIRMLITRAGHLASSDHDLLLLFYKGLNHNIQHECKINPMTGKFWDQFESLIAHALIVDTSHRSQAHDNHRKRRHGDRLNALNTPATKRKGPSAPPQTALHAQSIPTSSH